MDYPLALVHAEKAFKYDLEKSEIIKQNLAIAHFFNDNFDEIRHRLKEQTIIKNVGDDPVFYLIFSPEKILDVKSKIKTWRRAKK